MQYAIAALALAATFVNAVPALAPASSSVAEASASASEVLVTSVVYTTSEITVISCAASITCVFSRVACHDVSLHFSQQLPSSQHRRRDFCRPCLHNHLPSHRVAWSPRPIVCSCCSRHSYQRCPRCAGLDLQRRRYPRVIIFGCCYPSLVFVGSCYPGFFVLCSCYSRFVRPRLELLCRCCDPSVVIPGAPG